MDPELFGGAFAEEFHRIAAFDQADTLQHKAFKLDRPDFAPILFALSPTLRLFIIVEAAFDLFSCAVEEVHDIPEEVFEVGFDPRLIETAGKSIEDVGDSAGRQAGVGQRARVGLVFKGAMSKELHLLKEKMGGAGFGGIVGRFGGAQHDRLQWGCAALARPSRRPLAAPRTELHRGPGRGRSRRRRMAGEGYFASRCKGAPRAPAENSRPPAIAGPVRFAAVALLRRPERGHPVELDQRRSLPHPPSFRPMLSRQSRSERSADRSWDRSEPIIRGRPSVMRSALKSP